MKILLIAAASALTLMGGAASAASLFVPGSADPLLAGAPAGSSVTYSAPGYDTDYAPAESPVAFAVTAGETLTISNVTGQAGNCPGCWSPDANGGPGISSAPFTFAGVGFTPLVSSFPSLPINSLVGIFNGPSPSVFEIGLGGTFVAPTGATELYLGTVDGWQWNNNVGGYNLSISAVPEPATWAMLVLGLGAVGFGLRMSRRNGAMATTAA
jgi:hypothetical protein